MTIVTRYQHFHFMFINKIMPNKYSAQESSAFIIVFTRSGVAGAVLQTAPWFIHLFSWWFFSSQSSRHRKSQTVRARELTYWENVQPHHASHVTCHMSGVKCHFFYTNGGASRWGVSYQRDLPRSVYIYIYMYIFIWNLTNLAQ